MKSLILAIFFAFICAGCESRIDKLIPVGSAKESIQHVDYSINRQDGKSVANGYLLEATAAAPFDISRQQVRATLLSGIKGIKHEYRDCEWIFVDLCAEDCSSGRFVGQAEYREGKIRIDYWVPKDEDMAEWNRMLGSRKDFPKLRRPDKKTAMKCLDFERRFYAIQKAQSALRKTFIESETINKQISRETGIPLIEIEDSLLFCHTYYQLRDREQIQ